MPSCRQNTILKTTYYSKKMELGIGERIKFIRGGESQKDFGARFGVNLNTIGRYEAESTYPGADFIVDLCKIYGVSSSWLLFGEGDIYQNQKTISDNAQNRSKPSCFLDTCEFDMIPMVETKLSAGGGAFVVSEKIEGYYAFRKIWVRRVSPSPKGLFLMRVEGSSMFPTIQDGDTVMIDTNRIDIIEGNIYSIRYDSTVMIKRLMFRPGNKIKVISDNRTEYDSYEVDQKDLNILGQIIFFSRILIRE